MIRYRCCPHEDIDHISVYVSNASAVDGQLRRYCTLCSCSSDFQPVAVQQQTTTSNQQLATKGKPK